MEIISVISVLAFFAFCLLLVVVLGIGVFLIVRRGRERTKEVHQAWSEFARVNGLTLDEGQGFTYPKATGHYRGRSLTLGIDTTRALSGRGGSVASYFTRVSLPVSSPIKLRAGLQGIFDQIAGTQEIKTGNESFDQKYLVAGDPPDKILSILTPAVQSAMLENDINLLKLEQGWLIVRVPGFETRQPALNRLCDFACDIAQAVE